MKTFTMRDGNVYINGTSTHGQSSEITLPEISPNKSEYTALGMVGVLKIFKGFSAMEASIKWNGLQNDVAKACANPMKSVDLMIRANRDVIEGGAITDQQPVIYFLRGTPANLPLGTIKSGESTEHETKIDLSYIKWIQNGEQILELDIANNIFVVGGEDLLSQYRENLGI